MTDDPMPYRLISLSLLAVLAIGCGGKKAAPAAAVPPKTAPLPTAGLAGQPVAVYPLTMILRIVAAQIMAMLAGTG